MKPLQTSTASFVRSNQPKRTILDSFSELSVRLAVDQRTLNDAFGVRYLSYRSGNYIDRNADGLFADRYDSLPNSQSLVIYRKDRPVASVRVCILDTDPTLTGWGEIPANQIFPDEVAALAADVPNKTSNTSGLARAIEINRLVRHPDFATDASLVFALFRMATFLVRYHQTDFMMSCVRQNHIGFYKRLHLHNVAGPRRYAGVKFDTNLMACYEPQYDDVRRDSPMIDSEAILNGCYDELFRGEAVPVLPDV